MGTVILLHGWATDGSVWDGTEGAFGGHEIIKLTLPGHGGHGVWSEPTLEPAARELREKVMVLPDRSVIAVGWSLGAEVVISSFGALREKFRSLILVGANPSFVAREGYPWGQSRALVRRMIMDMKKDPEETLKRFYALNFTPSELESVGARSFIARYRYPGPVDCSGKVPGCYPSFMYGEITTALEALSDTDLRDRLSAIDLPTLIVHGSDDSVCPVGSARYLADNIKGATLKIFEGAGHAPFVTAQERFSEAVKEFLA